MNDQKSNEAVIGLLTLMVERGIVQSMADVQSLMREVGPGMASPSLPPPKAAEHPSAVVARPPRESASARTAPAVPTNGVAAPGSDLPHAEATAPKAAVPAAPGRIAHDPNRLVIREGRVVTAREMGQKPVVDPRKSIKGEVLVCLEDGKELKMLKRHLRATYGMTPAQYIAKWELPADYPMVSPDYSREKSDYALSVGLGTVVRRPDTKVRQKVSETV